MKQYIWFHPLYIQDTSHDTVQGQIRNALRNAYIVLEINDLHRVRAWDHLTIVGHSTAPAEMLGAPVDEDADTDTGIFIQGETAGQCVDRLQKAGLRVPPKILSLECCKAGVKNGLAQMLSSHPFFANSLIECSNGGIGRNPGRMKWILPEDCFGRVLLYPSQDRWIFLHHGVVIKELKHGDYILQDILQTILPVDFHESFFAFYKPGFFGGRAGWHCRLGNRITLLQAEHFAEDEPDSATAAALESVMIIQRVPGL